MPRFQVFPQQLQLGQSDIAQIEFNARSRDDIPQVLRGLQLIYVTPALRDPVFMEVTLQELGCD